LAWRCAMERVKGQVIHQDEEGNPLWTYEDEFLSQIADEAREFEQTHDEEAATSFSKIAKGEGTPVRDLIDTWLTEQGDAITERRAYSIEPLWRPSLHGLVTGFWLKT